MCLLGRVLLVLLLLAKTTAAAEPELVYTAPLETTLGRRDLRPPEVVWPEVIRRARSRIDVGQFYAALRPADPGAATEASGRALEPVLEALREVGGRGVRIRFFIDQNMEAESAESLAELRKIPNTQVRIVPWEKQHGAGVHHAKYLVVDGEVACVGSHNFDWRSLRHTQELGICLTDAQVVPGVEAIFERDFGEQPAAPAAQRPRPAAPPRRDLYLVASPAARNPVGVGDAEAELVRLIGEARTELAVQVLLYVPLYQHGPLRGRYYGVLDQALRAAATRGVQVRLLVSSWNADRPAISHLKSLALLPNVEIRMVTIPKAQSGFIPFARVIHSKFLVIDGETLWLGTSNWVGGYLDQSRNLELVLHRPELAKKARGLHQELWDSPYAEPLRIEKEYPLARRR